MNCPSCKTALEPDALPSPSPGARVMAIVLDWRSWALTLFLVAMFTVVGVFLGAGVAPDAVRFGTVLGAVLGFALAVLGLRAAIVRTCPQCGTTAVLRNPSKPK